jgi:hypothetical protein
VKAILLLTGSTVSYGFRIFVIVIYPEFDPDSIRPVDPDLDSKSGSGCRKAKMTHKRK